MVMRMLAFKPNYSSQTSLSDSEKSEIVSEKVKKKIISHSSLDQKTTIKSQEEWLKLTSQISLDGFSQQIIEQSVFKQHEDNKIHLTIDVKHKPILLKRHIHQINESMVKLGLPDVEITCIENLQEDNVKDLKEKNDQAVAQQSHQKVKKHKLFEEISEHLEVELV